MKLATIFTVLILVLFPLQVASAKKPDGNEVRLTAKQVAGADDIEAAIINATDHGKHSGTVILDGSQGAFVFTAPDKSVNVFVSSLTLRGENNAILSNCDDGLYFEGAPIHDVSVENITFTCTGDGVEVIGEFQDVTLSHNTIKAGQFGIVAKGASTGWVIDDNVIQARWDALRITGGKSFEASKNDISAANGIIVLTGTQFSVKNNTILAQYQGVLLGQEARQNSVQGNRISGVNLAGVALEPSASNNRVVANKVTCAPDANCKAVDAPISLLGSNRISGNK